MTTVDDARAAKRALFLELRTVFRDAALIGSAGLSRDEGRDFSIRIGLQRDPTAEERAKLPGTYRGLSVTYVQDGPIYARPATGPS